VINASNCRIIGQKVTCALDDNGERLDGRCLLDVMYILIRQRAPLVVSLRLIMAGVLLWTLCLQSCTTQINPPRE